MLIAEALIRIKDLESERSFLYKKIEENIYVLEEERAGLKVEELVDQYSGVDSEIRNLKRRVSAANAIATVHSKDIPTLSLAAAIQHCDKLRTMSRLDVMISDRLADKQSRFLQPTRSWTSTETITLFPNTKLSSDEWRDVSINYRDQARAIEKEIIKKNWNTEILE